MKRLIILLPFLAIALTACPQKPDQTFDAPVLFKKSITVMDTIFFGDKTWLKTAPTGSGGSVYWNDILDKPTLFPPAAHSHDGLYKPIGYVPSWSEITGKPSTYPPSAHNHDGVYKPMNYVPSWSEITNKPQEIELINELPLMAYLPVVQKTTTEINALVIPSGVVALVYDKTLKVLKLWDGTAWKILITSN